MKAELIFVGTELLLGDILNTNAQYLSRELAALGITVERQEVVGDNTERLAGLVREAKERCDLLVLTGGLGPTGDDLTKETVAACFDDELVLDVASLPKSRCTLNAAAPCRITMSSRRWCQSAGRSCPTAAVLHREPCLSTVTGRRC